MEEEFIEAHPYRAQYAKALELFTGDPAIGDRNRAIVLRFVREAALGKTVVGKRKREVGPARLFAYIRHLRTLIAATTKDLDQLTTEDMENFIEALDADRILSHRMRFRGRGERIACPDPFSPRYKLDIKVTIKKFYKWLLGESKNYPPLVDWIDTSERFKTISALTPREIDRLLDFSRSVVARALIQVLFDGGFRVGELLNVRLRHVHLRSVDEQDSSQKCFFLRVPFSKTFPRTVSLPMQASMKWLTLWLEKHPARPVIRSDGTLDAIDVKAQLFPMTADSMRSLLSRIGRSALGKRVYPHLFRHSSATYWSQHLSWFQMCRRFGWSLTSSMPQRYIDIEGLEEVAIAKKFLDNERARLIRENDQLRVEREGRQDEGEVRIDNLERRIPSRVVARASCPPRRRGGTSQVEPGQAAVMTEASAVAPDEGDALPYADESTPSQPVTRTDSR